MPIGKDSITKRVAKPPVAPEAKSAPAKEISPAKNSATEEKNIAPELVATVAAAPVSKKAPAKKTATSTAKRTTSTAAKKTSSTAKKAAAAESKAEKKIDAAVLSNVSPETVKAVIGHAENEKYEKVQIGQKLPDFLL